ncbi:MAG: methyltransferase [Pseudomonadota bacterium]
MSNPPIHGIYGVWPPALQSAPAGATQHSPLIPGSATLSDAALASMTMLAPPGTVERRYAMAQALSALTPGAPLTVFGPKDKGGNRIAKELQAMGCEVADVARHHYRISTTTRPAVLSIDAALLAGAPQHVAETGLWAHPGVFSWNRLDAGSALLLEHLPLLSGRGADLGGGIGVLSLAVLAAATVSELTLVELDGRAIAAAKRNISDPRVRFLWADACAELPLAALDFVVMNPPFHDGGIEDRSLGQRFVSRAAALLRPGGRCWLTANRHLPYEALLASQFSTTTLIADVNGYKIYESIR